MGRPPVLDEGGPAVPAHAPVQLLHVRPARPADRDRVPPSLASGSRRARSLVRSLPQNGQARLGKTHPPPQAWQAQAARAVFDDIGNRRAPQKGQSRGPRPHRRGARGTPRTACGGWVAGSRTRGTPASPAAGRAPRGMIGRAPIGVERRRAGVAAVPRLREPLERRRVLGPERGEEFHRGPSSASILARGGDRRLAEQRHAPVQRSERCSRPSRAGCERRQSPALQDVVRPRLSASPGRRRSRPRQSSRRSSAGLVVMVAVGGAQGEAPRAPCRAGSRGGGGGGSEGGEGGGEGGRQRVGVAVGLLHLAPSRPAVAPVRNMTTEMAAIPVEAPEARKSAPMSRASVQIGCAVADSSTPV